MLISVTVFATHNGTCAHVPSGTHDEMYDDDMPSNVHNMTCHDPPYDMHNECVTTMPVCITGVVLRQLSAPLALLLLLLCLGSMVLGPRLKATVRYTVVTHSIT